MRWDVVSIKGKGVEADQTDVCGKGALEGLIDPSSRAMNGEYSGSGSGSGSESGDEVGVRTLSLPDEKFHRAPLPVSTLSHPRTMVKRTRLPSTEPSTTRTNTTMFNYTDPPNPSFAPNALPTGPRTSNPPRPPAATQICFNWYHSQPCGRKCRYAHSISERGREVSLPLGIRGHRGCALELCPLREDLRAREAQGGRKKAKVKKVKDARGRSGLERQRGARGETEQEILEMRRRVASERKERKTRRRMERRREGMTLDYGHEVLGKQGGDGRLRKSDGVGRWVVAIPQKVRPRVLVGYELPEGEERLEWDTDLVRRIFGEIE